MFKLSKIESVVDNNKDTLISAAGDTSQPEPINEYSNSKNYDEYADECISTLFPYEIYLFETTQKIKV